MSTSDDSLLTSMGVNLSMEEGELACSALVLLVVRNEEGTYLSVRQSEGLDFIHRRGMLDVAMGSDRNGARAMRDET